MTEELAVRSGETEVSAGKLMWVGQYQKEEWHPEFQFHGSVEELLEEGGNPDVVVLALEPEEQDKQLWQIRQNDKTALSLVLVVRESPLSPFLSNGVLQNDLAARYQVYQRRKAKVRLEQNEDPASRLLIYLWLHNQPLQSKAEPSTSQLYSYPLLGAFEVSTDDPVSWLTSLVQKEWIQQESLTNRVRLCAHCKSGHLNYIDVCPACHSIDIVQQSALHCFRCGHVGAQDEFRKSLSLMCPNCLIQLRHIGVDYDRPIETQKCSDCSLLFSESKVVAECLQCGTANAIDELIVRSIYSYSLSARGRDLVQKGIDYSGFLPVLGEAVSEPQFYWLLKWLNRLGKRHQQSHMLVAVQPVNLTGFLDALGEAEGMERLDAIRDRIRSIMRITDACSNSTQEGLLILLPLTTNAQLDAVIDKLERLKDQQYDYRLDLQLKAVELPADIGDNVAAWLSDALTQAAPIIL